MATWEDVEMMGPNSVELVKGDVTVFIRAFRELTEIGRKLDEENLLTAEAMDLIQEKADTSDEPVTMESFCKTARRLYLIGEIRPKVEVPVVAPEPQLSASQKAWQEFRIYSETHSSAECKARAQNDSAYGSFYRKQFEREFAAEQVADAVVPAGQPTAKVRADANLVDFARRYNTTPISQLKPKAGFVVVGTETMRYEDFLAQQTRAANARLI